MRLRRVSSGDPGLTRHRRGRGFTYRDADGAPVREPQVLERIRALAIPPAWKDVWICADPVGHLQAAGTDAAGRRQYLYHDIWRQRRDMEKFDRMIDFAKSLPRVREGVRRDLGLDGMPRARVLACAVRILDRASFRIGSESYLRDNGSHGLATLRREHVRVRGDAVRFDFVAKSGQRRSHELIDPDLVPVIRSLKRRRNGGPNLLAHREGRTWREIRSNEINQYVKELGGNGFSAKDFRTWHGTVIAAVSLAVAEDERTSVTSRRRQISAAVRDVASFLGNTPAVARRSYVDPRVLDRFSEGITIRSELEDLPPTAADDPAWRDRIERAVLNLIAENPGSLPAAA
jgi:DNA topoisomerase I